MPSQPLRIRGEVVEEVEDYKYLGVVIDNRLDWKSNTEAVYKKGMSRLYFLRRLRSFNVGSRMLEIFYQSVVASAIFFAACVLESFETVCFAKTSRPLCPSPLAVRDKPNNVLL
ncbi:hypothetical protein L3Q82_005460 [Scortum barcoo]|uniref:Uncharacterized protein n=1 Tax=Scortum barcoo TaxID=214431 RepID=A0ACB8VA41_9TELE|nr:hypothetical protein L3Q82_005460 [Scortum barcoo]